MSILLKFPKYARRDDRDYYGYAKDKYHYKETTPIPGGFKVPYYGYDLIVGIPSEFAQVLKRAGVTKKHSAAASNTVSEPRVRTAITKFMGDPDAYGDHNCALLKVSEEDEEVMRVKAEVDEDCPIGTVFQKNPYSAKVFGRWNPANSTVVRDASKCKTIVTFKDDHEDILTEVHISDESDDSDDSDESDDCDESDASDD